MSLRFAGTGHVGGAAVLKSTALSVAVRKPFRNTLLLSQRWAVLEDSPVELVGDPGDGTTIDLDEPFLLRWNNW